MDEDLTVLETNGGNFLVYFLKIVGQNTSSANDRRIRYLLSKVRFYLLPFCSMNEGGVFAVETMEPMWFLVYESGVLRHELPSNFRRDDIGMVANRAGGHDG